MSAQLFVKILGGIGVIIGAAGIVCGFQKTGPMGKFSLLNFLSTRNLSEKCSRAQTIGEGIMSLLVGILIIYYSYNIGEP